MTTGLPIEDVIDDIGSALAGPGVAVVVAAPGAGKTTVVPLRLLGAPWRSDGRILVLEPRRVATRAAARRMADLLGEAVGQTVGFVTRDDRSVSAATRVEVITDGILTRRLQQDPELSGVSAVIFDEFHERRLQSDLGLALALDVRRSIRPDLRILVMSATIDFERIAALIGDDGPAPVVEASGRQFEVEVRWRPNDIIVGRRRGRALAAPVASAVAEALASTDGDVLAFLPGMGEIRATAEAVGREVAGGVDVRILHGSLSSAEQDAAISPSPPRRRKVVLSTDVAETSLTVEGVTAIVDGGMQRRPEFDLRSGLTRLVTVSASRASATQRAGRAGRLAPGVAIRLWSQAEHHLRPAHGQPEIAQVDVAGLLLEVLLWGAAIDDLALLDPPSADACDEAMRLLGMLGAVDSGSRLTELGRSMAALPLQPRTAAVLLAADASSSRRAALIAALLEEGDVLRGRPGSVESDLDLRLNLLENRARQHPDASGPRLDQVRRRAREIHRRVPPDHAPGTASTSARLLAAGYPDRIAQRRLGQRGRFLLRNGAGASVSAHDPLADAEYCVVADLDGADGDARIRLAAGMVEADVLAAWSTDVDFVERLIWDVDRNDLFLRTERRLGAIICSSADRRPPQGPETLEALTRAVGEHGIGLLRPSAGARRLQDRLMFLHRTMGGDWPDVGDEAITRRRDVWMPQFAQAACRRSDLERIDVEGVLRAQLLAHHHRALDRLAPASIDLPSGRRAVVGYDAEQGPRVEAKVQEVFGLHTTPTVADGAVPLLFDLRSPAGRTLQLTSDLAGFWGGSWHDVRKEMAGRYPKHAWPADPTG